MEERSFGGASVALVGVVMLVLGALGGYWYGLSRGSLAGEAVGYDKGYSAAEADITKLREEAAKKAVGDAAKAANPFDVGNPLEGVDSNPFEKVKKVLNPFE
jgi:hypothetical protein